MTAIIDTWKKAQLAGKLGMLACGCLIGCGALLTLCVAFTTVLSVAGLLPTMTPTRVLVFPSTTTATFAPTGAPVFSPFLSPLLKRPPTVVQATDTLAPTQPSTLIPATLPPSDTLGPTNTIEPTAASFPPTATPPIPTFTPFPPTATLLIPTLTPLPPTATQQLIPTAAPTGVNGNPWGYSFSCCNLIYNPPSNFCSYFSCIANFWSGAGYVIQCTDGKFSKSGGRSGSCSHHGGNSRPLYAP